jgi:hypothetical protein
MGVSGMIVINVNKAKNIAHELRRQAREVEFAPHDHVIASNIPGKSSEEAEAARQKIREKYAVMQIAIDNSSTIEELKAAMR